MCTVLPSSYQSECKELVREYGETIIDLILQEVTPDKLCSVLGLCGSEGTQAKVSDNLQFVFVENVLYLLCACLINNLNTLVNTIYSSLFKVSRLCIYVYFVELQRNYKNVVCTAEAIIYFLQIVDSTCTSCIHARKRYHLYYR